MAGNAQYNLHSRLVSILKLVLPLIALVLLSTLFLFSRKINPEDAIPYATVDIADRLQNPKMTDADYSAMTNDGTSIVISAAEAKPGADGASMKQAVGTLTAPSGAKTYITASTVQMNTAINSIALGGGTQIDAAGGYRLITEGLDITNNLTHVESTAPIAGSGPFGTIDADKMLLSRSDKGGPFLLVFKGNVRLIYQPQQRQDK
ncbi:MAG: hypothetical protein ACOH2M_04730 [Cypionkella sp.]